MIVTNVHGIDGIVNGTTNFILTRMVQGGAPYAEALAEAQELGYAEADPTEDVTGGDAAAKIALLASVAFHTRVRIEEVDHVGIDRLDLADVQHAGRPRLRRQADRLDPPGGLRDLRPRPPLPAGAGTTRWRPSRARSTPCCCRATRSAR